MLVVGIGYKKRSGKDTLAKLLKDNIKYSAIVSFAEALKLEVADVCGVKPNDIEAFKDVFRPMLQWWGTDFRRIYQKQDNYWIDRLDDKLEFMQSIGARAAFIADVRFTNEAEYVKSKGGILIRVDRPGLPKQDQHSSETSLDNYNSWDLTIDNNSTLSALNKKALELSEMLNRKIL